MAGEKSNGRSNHMETYYPAVVAIFATTVDGIGSSCILTIVAVIWRKPLIERIAQLFL